MQHPIAIIIRQFSTSSSLYGKRNFRKFIIPYRGSNIFKERQKNSDPEIPISRFGVKNVGVMKDGQFYVIPERVPEIIVPDLTNCQLKPYVSYRAPDVIQSEFTAEDLFLAVYSEKIKKDFETGQLDAEGNPLKPSEEELLTPDEAWIKARQTGSDIFSERSRREEEEKYDL